MSKIYNLVGVKFGKLTVIEKTTNPNNKKKATFWLCTCDCGKQSIVTTSALVGGKTKQCWDCAHMATGSYKRKDLTGMRFGKLTVQKMIYGLKSESGKLRTYCECLCDCGNTTYRNMDSLIRANGAMCSCGCARKEIADRCSINITGKKFGMLTVIEEFKNNSPRQVRCLCDCGNEVVVTKTDVMSFHTQSCGCLRKEKIAQSNTKSWTGYTSDYGVEAIKQAHKNKTGQWLWEYKCPMCGEHFVSLPARVSEGKTTSCGCRIQSSKEDLIDRHLKSLNVDYKKQYVFSDCFYKKPLKFDFAVFNDDKVSLIIEYDGRQHYYPVDFFGGQKGFDDTVRRDKIKDEYCKLHNIPLLRLKYDLDDNVIKEKITNIIYP